MDEQRTQINEPELTRPEEVLKDLEPDAHESETVKGGGIPGESVDDQYKNKVEVLSFSRV